MNSNKTRMVWVSKWLPVSDIHRLYGLKIKQKNKIHDIWKFILSTTNRHFWMHYLLSKYNQVRKLIIILTGSTIPLRVISPVIAVSDLTHCLLKRETSTVVMVTPADGPSLPTAPAGKWMWTSEIFSSLESIKSWKKKIFSGGIRQ